MDRALNFSYRLNPSDVRIRQKVETLREALDEQTCEEDDSDAQQQENLEVFIMSVTNKMGSSKSNVQMFSSGDS